MPNILSEIAAFLAFPSEATDSLRTAHTQCWGMGYLRYYKHFLALNFKITTVRAGEIAQQLKSTQGSGSQHSHNCNHNLRRLDALFSPRATAHMWSYTDLQVKDPHIKITTVTYEAKSPLLPSQVICLLAKSYSYLIFAQMLIML